MPSHVLAPAMNKNTNFDPIKDFTHIAYLGGPPNVFVVHPSAGVNSFKELLALMKSQPDGVQYVSPSIGSVGNMVAEYVADKEKVKLVHIVYRGGGSAIQDLVAGHVKVGSMTLSTTQPHILAGKLKPLAISSEKRLPEFPDVPTLVELGYPDLDRHARGIRSPARPGLPRDIVDKLNAAVNKAMALPEVQKHLETEMVQTKAMTPEQITAFMQREVDQWAPTARRIAEQNDIDADHDRRTLNVAVSDRSRSRCCWPAP